MRNIVAFNTSERGGVGGIIDLAYLVIVHYTAYVLGSNDRWQLYEDCKEKVIYANQIYQSYIDLLTFMV